MTRHWMLLGLAVAVSASGGCAGDQKVQRDAIAAAGQDSPALSRGQKPDITRTSGWEDSGTGNAANHPSEHATEEITAPSSARIQAKVNTEAILYEEVQHACLGPWMEAGKIPDEKLRKEKQDSIFKATLEALIDREVVLQDAHNKLSGNKNAEKFMEKLKDAAKKDFEKNQLSKIKEAASLKNDEEVAAYLKVYGRSLELMQREWERNFMKMDYLRNLIWPEVDRIGHAQVAEYYETHKEEFQVGDSVEWQDICIAFSRHPSPAAAKRFAEAIVIRARAGENFVELAQVFDDGDSSARKAMGKGNYRSDIQPQEVVPVLFALKEGEIGPPVELPSCIHIVRVTKRVYAGLQPFDEDMQKKIKNKLRNETAEREMKRLVLDMRRKAIVEYAPGAN